jgi:hypothetical protein
MDQKRMFRVIVVSGVGLVSPTLPAACSSGGAGEPGSLSGDAAPDGFPHEGTLAAPDAFPHEGPPLPAPDTGVAAHDANDANDVSDGSNDAPDAG